MNILWSRKIKSTDFRWQRIRRAEILVLKIVQYALGLLKRIVDKAFVDQTFSCINRNLNLTNTSETHSKQNTIIDTIFEKDIFHF